MTPDLIQPLITQPLLELDATQGTLPQAERPDPALPVVVSDPPTSEPEPSRAALLLSPRGNTASGNASRLLIGLGGIALLGLITPSATALSNEGTLSVSALGWLRSCLLQMSSFAAVAALALTMALPGLWILLGLFQVHLAVHHVFNAVARSYLRAGLFCLGFIPCILLYATTGGELGLTMFSGILCYFAAGALGLWTLAVELGRMLESHKAIGGAFVLGWFLLSAFIGAYLFVKLQVSIVHLEGGSL